MLPQFPRITDARKVNQHEISDTVSAVLLTDVVTAPGLPHGFYTHILVVFLVGEEDPVLFITAERSTPLDLEFLTELGADAAHEPVPEATTFLCAFDQTGHQNMGADEDWSDLARFEQAALRLVDDYISRGALVRTPIH